ncbi:hypothetical protein J7337_008182 [Fusarium musae]|uniref:Phenylacetyl-CoA ligase n=1 Tax=Fusarium musae TaxID=1042133 RepID=A0A9P8DDE0_9HYPO|nr:hypothetical protein J7337_008182 [Fusarium musae]KAG9499722.1 hypothetical protein J7337_008182 [Fusarium musae]
MVFESPAWARALPPVSLPDSITIEEFMYSEQHGRKPLKLSRNPYTCGLTSQTYTVAEVRERVDYMARAIAKRLDWGVANGTEWDKVACVFSWNTKGVMLSHYNIISNIALQVAYESYGRKLAGVETQVGLGLLPFSHIYGLVIISHILPWRGDEVVVLPRYNLGHMLAAIQKYKANHLPLVPPIAIQLLQNKRKCDSYDLSSLEWVTSGAAPLGAKTIESMQQMWPRWKVAQGYGLTESSPSVCSTSQHDILPGTSGSIVLGTRCKVIDENGLEVTELEKPGELFVQSPNICLGYMNNAKATAETFVWDEDGRWLRTGDVVVIRLSPLGTEHVVIVDRIKELIKVKGNQVAPAELEAHILSHPFVADCAVIPVPDDFAGEVPKAFVVKDACTGTKSDEEIENAICKYVESHKAKYKWLEGGVEFVEAIPKSPSGKILRRVLQAREKGKSVGATAKL